MRLGYRAQILPLTPSFHSFIRKKLYLHRHYIFIDTSTTAKWKLKQTKHFLLVAGPECDYCTVATLGRSFSKSSRDLGSGTNGRLSAFLSLISRRTTCKKPFPRRTACGKASQASCPHTWEDGAECVAWAGLSEDRYHQQSFLVEPKSTRWGHRAQEVSPRVSLFCVLLIQGVSTTE